MNMPIYIFSPIVFCMKILFCLFSAIPVTRPNCFSVSLGIWHFWSKTMSLLTTVTIQPRETSTMSMLGFILLEHWYVKGLMLICSDWSISAQCILCYRQSQYLLGLVFGYYPHVHVFCLNCISFDLLLY